MNEIFAELDRWQQQGEEIALATLVRVQGSAPRPLGARLCVTRSGKMAGSISGGCVETDVYERAMGVLDSGRPEITTYGIAEEWNFEVGLSCGGSIDVLIEPFRAAEAWQALRQAVEDQRPVAVGIGLTPASLLARKLVAVGDDTTVGSVDRTLDAQVAAEARRLLLKGETGILTVSRQGEDATIFIEAFPPPLRLFIVGATHTAIPLCRMAKGLGFRVTVIDARGLFATDERFPEADEIRRAWPDEILNGAKLDAYSYVVTLSHDLKFDVPALASALRSEARYVGIMGSRSTHEKRVVQLREQGFSETDLARIRAPIGLDIGSRTPEEIAIAILAEMLAVRYGRDGKPLTGKHVAIHGNS